MKVTEMNTDQKMEFYKQQKGVTKITNMFDFQTFIFMKELEEILF